MKQARPNCFPTYLVKDVCEEVLSKCYLSALIISPGRPARDLPTALRLREANNQAGETLLKKKKRIKKKAKIHPHTVITVNRNLVSSGGN